MPSQDRVIVIGGGFGGLAAAYELTLRGVDCVVLERDEALGGLAGTFRVAGEEIEKFYHHWFASDTAAAGLVEELGLAAGLIHTPTNTGSYYANSIYRLSTPMDLLRFGAMPLLSRLRTGWMVKSAQLRKDYGPLEEITAEEWVIRVAGQKAYDVMWGPLLRGKFGDDAGDIAAVWLWGKFKLRGGSRDRRQREHLVYLAGGFGALIAALRDWLTGRGVEIRTNSPVREIVIDGGRVAGVELDEGRIPADTVLAATQLPDLPAIAPGLPADYLHRIGLIRHYGTVCLVLLLDRSLSETYWLNVNDANMPFLGVIEHTNMIAPENYGGCHVVYVPKYLPNDSDLFAMGPEEVLDAFMPGLQQVFPEFERDWVHEAFAWKAKNTQPLIPKHYSKLRPEFRSPIDGLWTSTMAHIYPEDRGTNYAIAYGREVAKLIAEDR